MLLPVKLPEVFRKSLCVASGSAGSAGHSAGHSAVERETALVSLLSSRPLCGSLTVLAGNDFWKTLSIS